MTAGRDWLDPAAHALHTSQNWNEIPKIRGTQPHVGEGLEDEYSHLLVCFKGHTKQLQLWFHEQWKLLPQKLLTAEQRKIALNVFFFNDCTCTFYLKLPKNVFSVSLNNIAKNWKPCLLMGSSHRPFGKDLYLLGERLQGQRSCQTPPPSSWGSVFWHLGNMLCWLGFHIYGFDCKIPQPSSPRDDQ